MDTTLLVSGKSYIDIDALACVIAYSDFLKKSGIKTAINISKTLSESITPTVRKWISGIELNSPTQSAQVIVVDVSEPDHIDPSINLNQVTEIYDHHFGYEEYWYKKLGTNSHIESIGACATLIYEKVLNKIDVLDDISIDLLMTAILSNTLNLKAQITKNRDIKAYNALKQISKLPKNWENMYYEELTQSIFNNPAQAITNDIKVQFINDTEYVISQLELWESKTFLLQNINTINEVLKSYNTPTWFYTSPCISEGKNYLYCENENIKKLLHRIIAAEFHENIGETPKLWLRKEIIREMQTR